MQPQHRKQRAKSRFAAGEQGHAAGCTVFERPVLRKEREYRATQHQIHAGLPKGRLCRQRRHAARCDGRQRQATKTDNSSLNGGQCQRGRTIVAHAFGGLADGDGAQNCGGQHQAVAPTPCADDPAAEQTSAHQRQCGKSKQGLRGPSAQQPPFGKRGKHHAQADQKRCIAGLCRGNTKGFAQKYAQHQRTQWQASAQRIHALALLRAPQRGQQQNKRQQKPHGQETEHRVKHQRAFGYAVAGAPHHGDQQQHQVGQAQQAFRLF